MDGGARHGQGKVLDAGRRASHAARRAEAASSGLDRGHLDRGVVRVCGENGFHLMIVPYAGKPGQLQEFVKLYRRLFRESNPGKAEQIQVAQFGYVAEKRDEAMAGFRRICKRYLETFADAVQSWQGTSSDQYPGYDKMVASILATTPEKIIEQGGAFVGTPDDVIDQVNNCRDQFGGDIEPSMQINFGGSSDAEAFRTLELIASKVMPRV